MLNSTQVAQALGVNPSTLSRWRAQGVGPRVYWLGKACSALPRGRRAGVARTERGMSVRKTPGGRWRGVVKSGRQQVASRTFDTRRAGHCLGRPGTSSPGRWGRSPRRAPTVRVLMPEWLAEREHAVSRKTYVADCRAASADPAGAGRAADRCGDRSRGHPGADRTEPVRAGRVVGAGGSGRRCRRSSPGRCGSG